MERPSISVQLPALYPALYSASLSPALMVWVADYLSVGNERYGVTVQKEFRLLRLDPSF